MPLKNNKIALIATLVLVGLAILFSLYVYKDAFASVWKREKDLLIKGGTIFTLNITAPDNLEHRRADLSAYIEFKTKAHLRLTAYVSELNEKTLQVTIPGLKDIKSLALIPSEKSGFSLHEVINTPSGQNAAPTDGTMLATGYIDKKKQYLLKTQPVMTSETLKYARPDYDKYVGRPMLMMGFNKDGAKQLADLTRKNIGKTIAIVVKTGGNGEPKVVTAPKIMTPILQGNLQISGAFSPQDNEQLAYLIRAGNLLYHSKITDIKYRAPSFGAKE